MARLEPARLLVLLGALGLCAAAPSLAGGALRQAVHARLVHVAAVQTGAGLFTASGASGQTVVVSWKLSVASLSGPVRKATMQTPGKHRIAFTLCQPCAARSHGQIALLGSVWSRIVASGGTVVVATKAHPLGELRGAIMHG